MGRHRVKLVKFPVENYRYESWAVVKPRNA
jgi:hypothetical protein